MANADLENDPVAAAAFDIAERLGRIQIHLENLDDPVMAGFAQRSEELAQIITGVRLAKLDAYRLGFQMQHLLTAKDGN